MSTPRTVAGRFRLVLILGAAVHGVLGAIGILSPGVLEAAIGAEVEILTPGFDALARLYGGILVAVTVGYVVAVAQPQRSLLAVLFAVPLMSAVMTIAATALDEVSRVRGAVWAAFYLLYCLVFIRLYPRVEPSPSEEPEPGGLSPREPSEAPEDDER